MKSEAKYEEADRADVMDALVDSKTKDQGQKSLITNQVATPGKQKCWMQLRQLVNQNY